MSQTIWVLQEGQEQDDWDHSHILLEEKALNKLAKENKLFALGELLDYSLLNEEYGLPIEEIKYFEATYLNLIVESYITSITNNTEINFKHQNDLIEEFKDILLKINQAKKENKRLRLSVIP